MYSDRDFVGVADLKTLQLALYPQSYRDRPRHNRSGNRTSRRGPGPGKRYAPNRDNWQEMVVIPFFRRPGEMCAWAYTDLNTINFRPNPPDLEIPNAPPLYYASRYTSHPKLRLKSLPGNQSSRREAGLALLSTAHSDRLAFPGYAFATLAVEDAIRFQYRWLREYWEPLGDLPLVGAFDAGYYRTAAAWDSLADRQIILFGDSLTPALLRQAIQCDGKLIVRNYVFNRMQLAIRDPRFIVQEWIEQSLPWREFIKRVMFNLKTPEHYRKYIKLLIDARLPPAELGELFLGSNEQLEALHHLSHQPEFESLSKAMQRLRGVHCPYPLKQRIWKNNEHPWITLKIWKKFILSNGQIRWSGQVQDLRQRLYSFTVSDIEIRRAGLLKAVRRHIRAHRNQEPVFHNRNWHFCDRELTFPHIEVLPDADRLGFINLQTDQWVFRLPTYGVRQGKVDLDQKIPLVLGDCPAQAIEPPPPLTVELLSPTLNRSANSALFWAIQQVIYQLITAKCEFQSPLGVALVGTKADVVLAQISRILDAAMLPMPGPRYWKHHLAQLAAKVTAYDWPTVINSAGRSASSISRLLADLSPRQCLMSIPCKLSPMAQQQGWLTLEIPDSSILPEDLESLARNVLLNLLHQHQPGRFAKGKKYPWQIRVCELLVECLSQWGNHRRILLKARKLLKLPTTLAAHIDLQN